MADLVLFRCDAGDVPEIGTGHVRRCLLLADFLKRERGVSSRILLRDWPTGVSLVGQAGVPFDVFPVEGSEQKALEKAIREHAPDVVVFDTLDTSRDVIQACRRAGVVVVTLDDHGPGAELADLVLNGIRERPEDHCRGPEWVVLPQVALAPRPPVRAAADGLDVFLSFGGYDHLSLTRRTLATVRKLPWIRRVTVVGGKVPSDLPPGPPVEHHCETPQLPELLASADIAVVGGGLTLFEALRCGTPAVAVAQYPHQVETAERYEERGATISLGLPGEDLEDRLSAALSRLAAEPAKRAEFSRRGRHLVDGKGLQRVGNALAVSHVLEWDTKFFGRTIAQLNVSRLTPALVADAFASCKAHGVECLYYLADCHHAESVSLAERHGFHFVDIRLTFEYDLASQPVVMPPWEHGVRVRPVEPGDLPTLREIARTSYTMSRYFFDRGFPREQCEAFYTEWIEKCCRGYADKVLVATVGGKPAGYITCTLRSPGVGGIDLVGLAAWARGRSVGRRLVAEALVWFQAQDVGRVEVVTQGRNYPAQRLYQRAGFVTKQTQLWYHKWF